MGQLLGIKKWDQRYYKVGQLFYYKLKRLYYKVEQVLQSGTVLLQSETGITKWDDYYNVGFNTCISFSMGSSSFSLWDQVTFSMGSSIFQDPFLLG